VDPPQRRHEVERDPLKNYGKSGSLVEHETRLRGQPALPAQLARRANLLDEFEDVRVALPQFLVWRDEAHPALGAVHSSTAIPDLAHAKNLGPGTAGCKPGPAHS
jgi:hypothetical protein